MRVDTTPYPLVRLHYSASGNGLDDADAVLQVFEQLLARNQPFVFVSDGNPNDNTADEADRVAYRRKLSLWVKANKDNIRRLIKGQVHIAADASEAGIMQDFAPTFLKFWGFPLSVAHTPAEAQQQAQTLL